MISRILLIVSFFLLLSSSTKTKYFQGCIKYQLTFKPIHKNATVEFLEETYGVVEHLYYKNGFYRRVRLNKNGDTISELIHNPKKKRMYGLRKAFSDSILTYSSLDNVMESYVFEKLDEEVVNEETLIPVEMRLDLKDEFVFENYDTQYIIYYFSEKYKINPKNHRNQKDGFYDILVKQYPYMVLKTFLNDGYIKEETKTFTSIRELKIDDNFFDIDLSKPMKEI